MPHTTDQKKDDDSIDLRELIGTLLDRKWLIIAVTLIFLVVSLAYVTLATPIYQADSLLQVEQTMPTLPGLSQLSQTLGASTSQAVTEIALVTSRRVLGKAVSDLKLDILIQPWRFPLIGGYISRHYLPDHPGDVAPPHIGLSRYAWGGEKLDIYQLDVPTPLFGKTLTLRAGQNGQFTLYDNHDDLLLNGVVGQPASGHGVTIQVATLKANPGTGFDVVRQRTLAAIDQLQQKDIDAEEQGKDSGIIQVTYPNADPDLAIAVLNHIDDEYVRLNVARNSEEAAHQLEFVKGQLPGVRRDLEKAEAAMNVFQVKAHSVDITMQTKALLDQSVALDNNIEQLRMQQADIERRYTSQHPAYKALMQQIGTLNTQKDGLENQIGQLPDTQQQLLKLDRDVQVSNTTYTSLLNQAQQLDIARAGTIGNVRVVDVAATDITSPLKPKKILIVLIAPFLGCFLVIGYVLLLQVFNRGIEDPASIEEIGLPVYASIPLSSAQSEDSARERRRDGRLHLLAVNAPADLAVEALRSLRTSLHFAGLEAKNNVMMISGASPNAGKTFISTNLAAVIANAGQRVLLIDGDLRRGDLHRTLGDKHNNGLSELLSGKIDLEKARRHSSVENLDFIPRGQVPPNPSELLTHPNFGAFIERMAASYDQVIIDTPPILAVTDAAVIGRHAGISLLVARFGVNQPKELALAMQRFEQNGIPLKGAIFNAVEKRTSGYYSYGYANYGSAVDDG
ncbi:polysaccharide biosynthesis tyrosine autokinase [Rhodanobacter sp. A1T4]|uniref:polysaccharide biosynthesis tyrosine autokinase n=1 Tax=Rhodanobacter sp. A1T4 TaxID=2723087 RepID=UPI0016106F36|nr:polysaccharide biosynthesis tyrosine autokinase [Rhodanobacter sp. A1T4]MBB6247564.1 tyrosine-protein kinase Etk/Wzc [Rhodanobacter sp. A1T4]